MNAFLIKNKKTDLTFSQNHKNGKIKAARVFEVDPYHTNNAKKTFEKYVMIVRTPVVPTKTGNRRKGIVPLSTTFEGRPATINDDGLLNVL